MRLVKRRLLRGAGRVMVALAALLGVTLVAPGPAKAYWSGAVLGSSAFYGTCVEPEITYNNPGRVSMAPCYMDERQHWYADWVWDVPTEVRVVGPPYGPANKCLDAWPDPAYTNGFRVSHWDCNGGNQQLWRVFPRVDSQGFSAIYLRNERFNLCLDVHPGTRALSLYACHLGDHQLFYTWE